MKNADKIARGICAGGVRWLNRVRVECRSVWQSGTDNFFSALIIALALHPDT